MTTGTDNPPLVFPLGRAALVLVGVVTVAAAGGYLLCMGLGRPQQAQFNLLAAAVCGGSGLLGLLPVWLMSRSSTHGSAMGFMLSILLRMLIAGAFVVWAQWLAKLPGAMMLTMWVGAWYLLVLAVEVKLVSSHVLAVAPGPARDPADPPHAPRPHAHRETP